MKRLALVCAVAVAAWATLASGQTAARVERNDATRHRSSHLDARIPQLIAYQGKLTDSAGRPVDDGSYVMVFSLSADSTGSSFWHETQTVETRGGLFNVLLGSNVPISVDAIPQGGCYLGIRVLPAATEFRRQRMVSVPFAFQADNSDKLQGKDTVALDARYVGEGQVNSVTTGMVADTNITLAKLQPAGATSGQALAWDGSGWIPSSVNAVNADMVDGHHAGNDSNEVAVSNGSICVHLNAGLIQGKDTVQLNASYVNEGQVGSITGPMIRDSVVSAVHIKDSAVTAGKIAAGAVGSNEVADNSVTTTDIKDRTITSADIALSGVKAGTYGDGYHVARLTVDSAGRLTAAADTTILGAAPTGPAGGDLTGNYPNPAIAADKVTSAKILDGTIATADLGQMGAATNQVLKWNGTAWTPRIDSTGGAAGGDLTGNYPNPTIAADKVTSAKILDGTVARTDVASSFKAPYSDTADYAKSAPASDSARVAGNSHLLLGKDTTALWNAKTLQGKDTTALWNAKTLQGKDTAGFVRTNQANSISSAMIVNGTIVRADVASSFKAPFADTSDYAYAAPASDSARVAGNSHLLLGKDTTALWNAKTLQGKDTTALDARYVNEGQAAGGDLTGTYPNPTVAADRVTSAKIADGTIARADVATNFKAPYCDTADYAHAAPASDSARVAGNSHLLQGKDTAALWNAKTLQGKDTTALDARYVNDGQAAGGDLTGNYPNPTIATDKVTSAKILDGTIVRADVATDFKAPYCDTADYADAAPASDSARVAGNSHLLQGKDTVALWDAKTLQGKDTIALDARYVNDGQAAGGDLTGSYPNPTIATDKVTSTKILDGTIARADVASSFKAPFADTADYAISAPASDSARVAGNSHLLQGEDTAALWNAKTLQGKDTAALWNAKTLQGKDTTGFVRTNQADAVTSAMIADGTVVRADVASSFKAPFADTADYAISAPAAESAGVAGNSHLLQGKDTAALWDAKTLQGQDTTALDARYVNEGQSAGGDLTGDYPNPTIAANAVTPGKIARGSTSGQAIIAQGSGADPVWGYPNAVGESGTPVTFVKTDTFSLDLGSIGADSVYQATVYIPGLLTGDRVFLSYPTTGDNWQFIQGLGNCQVTADDSLAFRVWNSSASAQDPGAATWRYMWIRPQ